MTEQDLNARLARMESDVSHTKRAVDRIEASERDFIARLAHLEAGDKRMAGLPDRMAHTESVNEVQEAVKRERNQIIREIRVAVYGAIGAAATIIGGIVWLTGSGQ